METVTKNNVVKVTGVLGSYKYGLRDRKKVEITRSED